MCVDSRAGHDGRVPDLHPQPHLLAVGRLLHHLHRAGRAGIHDPVGRQPGLHLYDQSYYVYWVSFICNSGATLQLVHVSLSIHNCTTKCPENV